VTVKTTAIAFALVATLASTSRADQISDDLRLANLWWRQSVESTQKSVRAVMEQVLAKASDLGDLQLIREVREDASAFVASGAIPQGAALSQAAAACRENRIKANVELSKAYRTAILTYTKAMSFDKAEAVEEEFESFLLNEQDFLDGAGRGRLAATQKEQFLSYVKEFATELEHSIEQVAAQRTYAKRQAAHNVMMNQLDRALRGRTITLRFPVEEVKMASDERFVVRLAPPEGLKEIEGAMERSEQLTLRMDRGQGLSLSPGDYLVFTGTPRFGEGDFDRSGRTFAAVFFDLSTEGFDRYPQANASDQFRGIKLFNYPGYSIFLSKSEFKIERD
jgi:hypothetical protein